MSLLRQTALCFAATVMLGLPVASADTVVTSSITNTSISGNTGTGKTIRSTGLKSAYLKGIAWSERSDDPCWLQAIYGWEGYYNPTYLGAEFKGCAKRTPSLKKVTFSGVSQGVRGIQVCTSKKKNSRWESLKGIKIFGGIALADGTVKNDGSTARVQRTHCKRWHTARYCPANQMAVGLTVYQRNNEVRGIGLQCAQVKYVYDDLDFSTVAWSSSKKLTVTVRVANNTASARTLKTINLKAPTANNCGGAAIAMHINGLNKTVQPHSTYSHQISTSCTWVDIERDARCTPGSTQCRISFNATATWNNGVTTAPIERLLAK